jgi:hypothetical protein
MPLCLSLPSFETYRFPTPCELSNKMQTYCPVLAWSEHQKRTVGVLYGSFFGLVS